ncbi:hypothetical protein BFR77_01075 [Acinetobacter pittii]|uniref:hypothetical protein n=1 Tax=Acinetobacter pittii TaxID=48296 RepID=UPI0008397775|nr:hypothetical protein [Acinetobacter pittii]OCY47364.1 hypothetical protein BFR77_01075 [Acinetobacter pittii]
MSDKTTELDEYQKNFYENNLLEIYKLLLIIRNIVKVEKLDGEISHLEDQEQLIEEFEIAAGYIKQLPLYFGPDSEISEKVQSWLVQLREDLYLSNGIFNPNILKVQKNLASVLTTAQAIRNYFDQKSEIKNTSLLRSHEYNLLNEKFRSYDITYENTLKARELSTNIEEIRTKLEDNLKQSDRVKEIFTSIENQHQGFNAFFEKNHNDETKKIYDEVYKSEYSLADQYRKYAIWVFLTIAVIAIFNFLIPTIEGSINFFNNKGFTTSPIDTLFFLRTIFMLLLTAPGWYFARESAKHRQVAYKAKIVSAELSALPFYLADLDLKDRHEMRMKMADKFFGQELFNDKKSDSSNVSEQAKATAEAIKTLNALLNKSSKPSDAT